MNRNDLGKTPMPLIVVTEMKAAKKKDGEKRKTVCHTCTYFFLFNFMLIRPITDR